MCQRESRRERGSCSNVERSIEREREREGEGGREKEREGEGRREKGGEYKGSIRGGIWHST